MSKYLQELLEMELKQLREAGEILEYSYNVAVDWPQGGLYL